MIENESTKHPSGQGDFSSLGLGPKLIKALKQQNIRSPYPIQQKTIPPILQGKDLCAASPTGSGKTAAYLLPLLQMVSRLTKVRGPYTRALILCPTRELAVQIHENLQAFSKYTKLNTAMAFGGVSINPQMMKTGRGVDFLVATPGRLLDLYSKNAIAFTHLNFLVLDEADKMLNLGFEKEIDEILKLLPNKKQSLLFSATYPEDLSKLTRRLMHHPLIIGHEKEQNQQDKPSIKDWIHPLDKSKKAAFMVEYLLENPGTRALIFCKTKNGVDRLIRRLKEVDIRCMAIHGDKSQGARQNALDHFRTGRINLLAATDLASRGLDIEELPLVINYDLPHLKEDYIHRIGRTGRAGAEGQAFSLVCAEEHKKLIDIERLLQRHLERREQTLFPVKEELRPSPKILRPHPPKKPKKKKKTSSSEQ